MHIYVDEMQVMLARKLGVPLDAMWTGRPGLPVLLAPPSKGFSGPGPQHTHRPLDCATGLNLVSVVIPRGEIPARSAETDLGNLLIFLCVCGRL